MVMHWLTSMNLINQLSTNIYICMYEYQFISVHINQSSYSPNSCQLGYTIAPFPSCFPPSQRWDLSLPSGSTWRCWRRWSKTSGQFTAICVVDIWVLCGAWTSDTSCTLRGRKETCFLPVLGWQLTNKSGGFRFCEQKRWFTQLKWWFNGDFTNEKDGSTRLSGGWTN